MKLLAQVVSDLEMTPVTAEQLTITRLGLYINNVRRKTSDKALAKRMKDLLKEWKKIVQNSQSNNGVSPVVVNTSIPPIITSNEQNLTSHLRPIETVTAISAIKNNDALSHRKALASRFSACKTPSVPKGPLIDGAVSNSTNLPTLSDVTINGATSNVGSLTVSFPLVNLSCQQQDEEELTSLIIKIPLSSISIGKKISNTVSVSEISSNKTVSSFPPISSKPTNFVNNSDLHTHNVTVDSLMVHISLSKLPLPPMVNDSSLHYVTVTVPQYKSDLSISAAASPSSATAMDFSQSVLFSGLPAGRLKPQDCIEGVDGCYGIDRGWYSWTDVIPNEEPAVTVLPYVFIDGFDVDNLIIINNSL
jgi:hypothetical protein